jgi:hypothetical protein
VGEGLPSGVETLYAPMVINRSSEPAFETVVTEALRMRLIRAGVLGASDSPVRLQGELFNINTAPVLVVPSSDGGAVSGYASYRVSALLRLTITRQGEILAKSEASGFEDYLPNASTDVLYLEAQRQLALNRLANTLVRDAYDKLVSRK